MIPAKIYETFITTGEAKAQAHYAYQQLESQTKPILAQVVMEAKEVDGVSSMAEATQIALASSLYRDHLRDVCEARLEYDLKAVRYSATEALFQAQRSLNANERASLGAAP